MKIRLSLFVLTLCAALLLCACGSAAPAVEEPAADLAAQEELAVLFSRIRQNVTIATAGSSLRTAAAAAELLDWAETAEISDEQILAALEPWLEAQEDGIPAEFLEQLGAVGYMAQLLTGEDTAQAEGLLSDAGCTDCGYPWSDRARDTVARIMALAGLQDDAS